MSGNASGRAQRGGVISHDEFADDVGDLCRSLDVGEVAHFGKHFEVASQAGGLRLVAVFDRDDLILLTPDQVPDLRC